ncbi:hypothetical protein [Algivirga pacifica]|uniref:Uncharacterized protein n=1 Tax=Algivirga pacifica TaxID=1162670 RepID=A0ABP9DIJ9_9BACT
MPKIYPNEGPDFAETLGAIRIWAEDREIPASSINDFIYHLRCHRNEIKKVNINRKAIIAYFEEGVWSDLVPADAFFPEDRPHCVYWQTGGRERDKEDFWGNEIPAAE